MPDSRPDHGTKTWAIEVSIDEHHGMTRAKARLRWRDQVLVGVGTTRLDPHDRDVAEIGDELAVGRAVSDLGRRMLVFSAGALEEVAGRLADIRS